MSANFDWQTEEDNRRSQSNWHETPEPRPRSPSRRPRWRLIGLIAVLAIAAGLLVWWRAAQRIEATSRAVRADVITSHNLAQRAATDGDEEIFRSLLSGRDPAWTAGELDLFHRQLLIDRSPLGLTPIEGSLPALLPESSAEAAVDERAADIELSPDFTEAVVTVAQPFQLGTGPERVILQQTTVYRRGDVRWLLAPPLDEFWGEWQTDEGEYIDMIYPERDGPVATRLAADLDTEVARMCDTLEEIDCSADLFLTVRFDTDPGTLASLSQPLGALQRARRTEDIIELPTPTLVGLPAGSEAQQEAGYRALQRGYAQHLVRAVLAQVVGWQCCEQDLLTLTLLEYQLGKLGLFDWTVTAADYRRVLESRVRLSDLNYIHVPYQVAVPEERVWQARAAVDFLANGLTDVSVADMQRIANRSRNFSGFLNRLWDQGEQNRPLPKPDVAWWLYAFQQSLAPADPPASPEPEELYLACTTMGNTQRPEPSFLFRYLAEESQWEELYRLEGFIWMAPLPIPRALLLQEFILASESWQTALWRDGQRVTAFRSQDLDYTLSFGQVDPGGQRMVAYTFDADAGRAQAFTLDLDQCDEVCASAPLPSVPYWSPNGDWAIYAGADGNYFRNDMLLIADGRYLMGGMPDGFQNETLLLGPGDAQDGGQLHPIGNGYAPFWLDDTTYGYVRRIGESNPALLTDQEIVIATLDDPTVRPLLASSELSQFMPNHVNPRWLEIGYVATHPAHPDLLFIAVFDQREQQVYIFAYDRQSGLADLRVDVHAESNHSLGFSPDGRYLVVTGQYPTTRPGDNSGILLLHDIAANQTIPFNTRLPFFLPSAVYDWTDDSRWFAVALDDNLVGLIAPEEGYVQTLPHTYGACTSVAWMER